MKRTIYSNYNLDEDYEYAKEYLIEEEGIESPSDIQIWNEVHFIDEMQWDDFVFCFKQFLETRTLLCMGTVGRWNGTYRGGKVVETFKELSGAWQDCDYIEVYEDNGHLYLTCSHHDGTNHFEIKELNERGKDFYNRRYYDYSDRELHEKLWKSTYSKLPRYCEWCGY